MSYVDIAAGMQSVLETVTGLAVVLPYVPRAFQKTPLLYSCASTGQLDDAGTAATAGYVPRHKMQHRLVLNWQDNEQCELTLNGFIESIPQAIKADPTLGGVISDGEARIVSYEAGWVTAESSTGPTGGALTYRICDFYSEIWEV